MAVIRLTAIILSSVLLLASPLVQAQGGARHTGAHASEHSGNPESSNDTGELKDFERGFALQATPDQVSQFQVLSKHTESAHKQAHDFLHLLETGSKPPEFSDPADDLQDAVQEAYDGSKEFVQKFSAPQKSAYKGLAKKLAKANSDVAKQGQALKEETKGTNVDNQNLRAVLKKLEQALSNLQAEQADLGKAMGIQIP
jgi:flagellin-like hook-associated protein FlgL